MVAASGGVEGSIWTTVCFVKTGNKVAPLAAAAAAAANSFSSTSPLICSGHSRLLHFTFPVHISAHIGTHTSAAFAMISGGGGDEQ